MLSQEAQRGIAMPLEDEEWANDLMNGINGNLQVLNTTVRN